MSDGEDLTDRNDKEEMKISGTKPLTEDDKGSSSIGSKEWRKEH